MKVITVKMVFHRRTIWIPLIAGGMIFSGSSRCVAAPTTAVDTMTQTNRIESAAPLAPASNVAVTPRRMIMDDPPTREPGTKKRAQYIAGFGLVVISFLILIVGVGILRAFRQR